jgi:hypothetical protein
MWNRYIILFLPGSGFVLLLYARNRITPQKMAVICNIFYQTIFAESCKIDASIPIAISSHAGTEYNTHFLAEQVSPGYSQKVTNLSDRRDYKFSGLAGTPCIHLLVRFRVTDGWQASESEG